MACQEGHIEVVKVLIEASTINVNYAIPAGPGIDSNNEGLAALFAASENGHVEIVKALLDANADFLHTLPNGDSALDIAIHFKHSAVIDMLKARIAQRH